MHKGFLKIASLIGAISVALGAFAAHSLKASVTESVLGIFETAVRYQFYHVFALMSAGILYGQFRNAFIAWSGRFFVAGIILFSGSLYILTYVKATAKPGLDWIGAITPIGGIFFIAGWIFLLIGLFNKTRSYT